VLRVDNYTPFVPGMFLFPDAEGCDTLYVVLKATFSFAGGRLSIAGARRPIVVSDTFSGEPGASSLVYASEAHLLKPTTDVAVIGEAFAPGGRSTPSCAVLVSVGPVRKLVQVLGDRTWRTGIGGQRPSLPEPFVRMPVIYERAFGGSHDPGRGEPAFEPRNPVGVGFRGNRSSAEMDGTPLPNIEDPRALIQSPGDVPPPAGLGFVAPAWEPRRGLAGTYDEAWRKARAPYLPADFHPRFFQAATPDLVCPAPLVGGEPVELANLSPEGAVRFRLPMCAFDVEITVGDRVERPPMIMETVLLEPSESLVTLAFRGAVSCDKEALRIESARFDVRSLRGVEGA